MAKQSDISSRAAAIGAIRNGEVLQNIATIDIRLTLSAGVIAQLVSAADDASITLAITRPSSTQKDIVTQPPAPAVSITQPHEVIFLDYADVSEVAGLISSTAVASNDT